MSHRNRIPPLLEPYLGLPAEASLLLLTGVLNATPNWLVTRYLSSILGLDAGSSTLASRRAGATRQDGLRNGSADTDGDSRPPAVVFVSWMRDWDFWRLETRRGGGLDLARLAAEGRFIFVDGLTQLFAPDAVAAAASKASVPLPAPAPPRLGPSQSAVPARQSGPLPLRGPAVGRAAPTGQNTATAAGPATVPRPATTGQPALHHAPPQQPPPPHTHKTLRSPSLTHALSSITSAIACARTLSPNVVLVLDAPTLLLATTAATSSDLLSLILQLRDQVHSALVVLEADAPLLAAARPDAYAGATDKAATPIEVQHAAFVVQVAHSADWVLGCRPLETGVARDVGGVLRVVRGGAWEGVQGDGDGDARDASAGAEKEPGEMEALYHVQPDGGVKVFERGAGDVG